MRDAIIQYSGFNAANEITEDIKDGKAHFKNFQDSVLEDLADNQSMILQVANHIDQQPYHDRRIGLVPYEYIND